MVPVAGFEPARPKAGDFESPKSTIPSHWHQYVKVYIKQLIKSRGNNEIYIWFNVHNTIY